MNKNVKIGLAALALFAAPLTYNLVMAQQTGTPSAVTQALDYSKVFVQKLAGILGIDQAKLETAIKTAGNATVDEALKNQDITKDQATQMKAQVAQGDFGIWKRDGRDGNWGRDGRDGRDGNWGRDGMMGGDKGDLMDEAISRIALLESRTMAATWPPKKPARTRRRITSV